MNRQIFFLLMGMILASHAGQSQIITPAQSRQAMLEGMHLTLQNVDVSPGDYEEVQSPFVVVSKPEPQVMLTKDLSNVPVDTGIGEVLPDEDALRIISQQFKPFGSLVIGERGVLQLARGQTIAEGESFKAEIRGVAYEVQIMDVTSKSYKLSLGTAEVEKNFFTTTGSNQ